MGVEKGAKQAIDMDVALAANSSLNVEFEVGEPSGNFRGMSKRGFGKGSAPQIRVQNNAGCIDDWAQGMPKRLANVFFDGFAQSPDRESQCGLLQQSGSNFFPQASEHGAGRVGD